MLCIRRERAKYVVYLLSHLSHELLVLFLESGTDSLTVL